MVKNYFSNSCLIKKERGNRIFPVTDKAKDVLDALIKRLKRLNVKIRTNSKVNKIILNNEENKVQAVELENGEKIKTDKIILATGGKSYPLTGSNGDGYKLAEQVGHNITKLQGSIIPVTSNGEVCKKLQGLSLKNVNLSIIHGKKKLFTEQGEMLFTHFGISGPLVLSASCHIKDKDIQQCVAVIDLKPALTEEVLYKRICTDFEKLHSKKASSCLDLLLPKSMIDVMLKEWGIDTEKTTNQITKEERMALVKLLKGFKIPLNSKYKLEER